MDYSSSRGQQPCSYGSVEGQQFQPSPLRISQDHKTKFSGIRNGILQRIGIAAMVTFVVLGATMATTSDGTQRRIVQEERSVSLAEITSDVRRTDVGASASSRESSTQEPLAFTALNFYHIRDGKPGQDYPWLKDLKVIEPYQDTTLTVSNARDGFEYQWEVRARDLSDGDSAVLVSATGATTVVSLTKLDENVITLKEANEEGQVVRRLDETVMVKYVRREIRSLTDEDLNELLDAMHELWSERVVGGNGKEKYGDGYTDIWAINRLHFKAATVDSCDHFHDGLGFLVSHTLISNTFEHSLQIVNPKLTLPYWDFTIEESSSAAPVYDPTEPWTRSSVLQASIFGSYDPKDHIVKDGRWAFLEIPSVEPGNPGNLNTDVYGKLRSPWNTNDRPYLTRGMGQMCQINFDDYIAWPTCQKHYDLVTGYSDFYSWVWESMGNPHAPVHFWVGGNLDCQETFRRIGDLVGPSIAAKLTPFANAYRKGLYCDGIWSCEGIVDISMKPYELAQNKVCGCHGYNLDEGGDYKFVMERLDFLEFYIGHFDEHTQREVVKGICDGVVNYGEHGQSSSTLDPSFWPTHPTMDRLWQFSVLTESVTDFNWPDKNLTFILDNGESYTQVTSSYYEECFGHRGMDVFPYGLLDDDGDDFEVWTGIRGSGVGNTLSNREVLAAFDPRFNSMNYIYDTFKWTHCEQDGVYMDDAWGDTSSMVEATDHRFFESQKPLSAMYINFKREMADLKAANGEL
ncbi:unnamed protein product [Ascophyllum nodosum]